MALDGVEGTELQFEEGLLTVDYDAADTDPKSMIAALVAAGYGAQLPPAGAPRPLAGK